MGYKIYYILGLMVIRFFFLVTKFSLARNLDPHIPQNLYSHMSNTLHLSYLTTQ